MTIYVVDPELEQVWTSPMTSLSQTLQDQVSSTNTSLLSLLMAVVRIN